MITNAEPDTVRFRLYHLSARLAKHARQCWRRIEYMWPFVDAFTTAWRRLTALPAVA